MIKRFVSAASVAALLFGCQPSPLEPPSALEASQRSSDGTVPAPGSSAQALVSTPTPPPPPPRDDVKPGELLVDDMYACDPGFRTRIKTFWYPYDDHDREGEPACNHGRSESRIQMLLGGYKVSPCALQWSAALQTPLQKGGYAFSGIGLGIGNTDLSQYSTLQLVVRGDGRPYRIKFPMQQQAALARAHACGNDYWNFYGANFSCGNGSSEWAEVRINLRKLAQEPTWPSQGPGRGYPYNASQVKNIEIQTIGGAGKEQRCDFGLVKLIP